MTPDLWILWVWLSMSGVQPTPMAAAYHTEQACEAAKEKIKEEAKRARYSSAVSVLVCTPNFQVPPR